MLPAVTQRNLILTLSSGSHMHGLHTKTIAITLNTSAINAVKHFPILSVRTLACVLSLLSLPVLPLETTSLACTKRSAEL